MRTPVRKCVGTLCYRGERHGNSFPVTPFIPLADNVDATIGILPPRQEPIDENRWGLWGWSQSGTSDTDQRVSISDLLSGSCFPFRSKSDFANGDGRMLRKVRDQHPPRLICKAALDRQISLGKGLEEAKNLFGSVNRRGGYSGPRLLQSSTLLTNVGSPSVRFLNTSSVPAAG